MTDQERLDAAIQALHDLTVGRLAEVVVDSNGTEVRFTKANMNALKAYIRDLEILINGSKPRYRPIRVIL